MFRICFEDNVLLFKSKSSTVTINAFKSPAANECFVETHYKNEMSHYVVRFLMSPTSIKRVHMITLPDVVIESKHTTEDFSNKEIFGPFYYEDEITLRSMCIALTKFIAIETYVKITADDVQRFITTDR